MDALVKDVRYSFRLMLKNPGFTLIAVAALVLGIGANSAIFTVVNAVMLRPLPYPHPDRLVRLYEASRSRGLFRGSVSLANFLDWRNQDADFEHLAAFNAAAFNRSDTVTPEHIKGVRATTALFRVLGVQPFIGRDFRPDEEKTGKDQVVILSHSYWERSFGAAADAVGRTVMLDGRPTTVIGVLPKNFRFSVEKVDYDIWTPLPTDGEAERGAHFLKVIGRLKPGVELPQAQARLDALARTLEAQYPETNTGAGVFIGDLHHEIVGDTGRSLYVLLGAVGLVLLIACVNIANLTLSRSVARQKEIAVLSALGATRGRIIRQLLTESLMLSVCGGGLGLFLGLWGVDALLAAFSVGLPRGNEIGLDFRVLGFTALVSLATGLLFGLIPAVRASNPNLVETLKDGAKGAGAGTRGNRLQKAFIVLETALSLILLVGAGLLARSLVNLHNVDPGFNPRQVLKLDIALSETKYGDGHQQAVFYAALLERCRSIGGVDSAALAIPLPMSGSRLKLTAQVENRPERPGEDTSADWRTISGEYFRIMGIPMLRGRAFNERDSESAPKVVIVNESFSKRFFPDENPLGKRIVVGYGDKPYEIVGIVGDVKFGGPASQFQPEMYTPYQQTPWPMASLVFRTKADSTLVAAAVQGEVKQLDAELPIYGVRPLSQLVFESVAEPRFNTILLSLFAVTALVLAVIGIYGVMSYSVGRRTSEIGIRIALGAEWRDIAWMVVSQGMSPALIGVGVGLTAAFFLSRMLSSLLFKVDPTDGGTFLGVSVMLLGVACVACLIPALRATRIDPMTALRIE